MSKLVTALGLLIGLALAAAAPACFTSRRSDAYACTVTAECDSPRVCVSGFCVAPDGAGCPSPCTSCDLTARTCRVECSAGKPCGTVTCPAGFDCTVRCASVGACTNVDCSHGDHCDITCSGAGSCGNVTCSQRRCDVECTGGLACGTISCASSCRCDVSCSGNAACPVNQCPMVGNQSCTTNGMPGPACDSGFDPGCDRC